VEGAGSNPVVRSTIVPRLVMVAIKSGLGVPPPSRHASEDCSDTCNRDSKLLLVQPSDDPSRTTQLLAERWAARFCSIQRGISRGEVLKFAGAFLAAAAWFTFLILAKGTEDFQASDLVLPSVLTAIAVVIGALGFYRENRARKELKEAAAKLAIELERQEPPSESEPEQSSNWP